MESILPIAQSLPADMTVSALPIVAPRKCNRRVVDPDLEWMFTRKPTAKIPYIIVLIEPFPLTDPRAVDTTSAVYREALAALASPVVAMLDRLQTGEHLVGYKVLAHMAFFSACGDLESVRALSTLSQVEFIAYDGIPGSRTGPEQREEDNN
jgi:hypothetical protein